MDKPLTEREQNVVLLWCLRDLWDDHTVTGDPTGDRIFVRYVDWRPDEDAGWNDWSFVGTIVRTGDRDRISFLSDGKPNPLADQIAYDIREGAADGRYEFAEGLVLWWVRYTGDGPEGERVEDWGPNDD